MSGLDIAYKTSNRDHPKIKNTTTTKTIQNSIVSSGIKNNNETEKSQ